MGYTLGMNAKISYESGGFDPVGATGPTGTVGLPDITGGVGVVIGITKDVTLNLETAEADVTTRDNNGWRATVGTLKEGTVEFQVQWDSSNAAFQALMAAWEASLPIGLAVLDETYLAETTLGANDGDGTGLIANFSITNFTREEGLEDAIMANVTAKPTFSDTKPGWLDRGGWIA